MIVETVLKGEVTRGRNGKLRYRSSFRVDGEAKRPRLNRVQERVLALLAGASEDFGFFDFKSIQKRLRINRSDARLACRALARKGLSQFGRGLCTEDGDFRGSGYAATDSGRARADAKLVARYDHYQW